ncbi:MAG: translation initiation factor IF-3 [Candidatus Levyibacteriota bacterium]
MRKGFSRSQNQYRLNNQITAHEVRLIDDTGKQIGITPIRDALQLSLDQGKDLVEIAPLAKPPVVKLIDYRKFLYQEKKRKQEEKRNAHVAETKQIRFGPFINEYDLDIRVKQARKFIADGNKVKFLVRFQGRAITKQDLGRVILNKVIEKLADVTKVDREIHMEGRQMVLVLSKGKPEERKEDAKEEIKSQEVSIQ